MNGNIVREMELLGYTWHPRDARMQKEPFGYYTKKLAPNVQISITALPAVRPDATLKYRVVVVWDILGVFEHFRIEVGDYYNLALLCGQLVVIESWVVQVVELTIAKWPQFTKTSPTASTVASQSA